MQDRYIIIMAGGRGERFWPQSRLQRPKHLLPIVGEQPLLTQAIERLGTVVPVSNIIIITNSEQKQSVLEVCPMLTADQVVGEPVGRDTAAAVALATVIIQHKNPNALFGMLPADHVVQDAASFQRVIELAFAAAEQDDALVTIGIKPEYPATGYGYIQRGGIAFEVDGKPVYTVSRFKEKPDLETAQSYVDSGDYFWNAGMFFWRAGVIAQALERLTPGLWMQANQIRTGLDAGGSLDDLMAQVYPGLEKISVDFAVMEKADKVLVVESEFDWDDVGEWPAIARHYPADPEGNVIKGDALVLEGANNIVVNEKGHTTVLIGLDDLIVVQTADATLVCHKSKAQEIKKAVRELMMEPTRKHLV